MSTSPGRSRPWSRIATVAGATAACAVCCAGPLLAVLGSVAGIFAVGAIWIPVLAVIAVAAALGAVTLWRRRRSSRRCTPTAFVDLGMPGTAPPADVDQPWSRAGSSADG